jgi:hypothetical protein
MSQQIELCDLKGFYALPGVISGHPEDGKGQQLTNAAADTNTTATVISGKTYRVTALNTGGFLLGLSTTATVANIMWVCPLHESILIHIDPVQAGVQKGGDVTLNYQTDTNAGIAYLVELDEHSDN